MRRSLVATFACVCALMLSSCAGQDIVAQPVQTPQSGPVIETGKVENILKEIQSVVDHADATGELGPLNGRLLDPALRMRHAQYSLAQSMNSTVTPLKMAAGDIALTDTATWPRAVVNIVNNGEASLPTAYVLMQDEARSPYRLHSWARILGGTTFTIASVKKGSPTLAEDSPGFVSTPKEAIEAYVNMLNEGNAGNTVFATDEFASNYLQDARTLNEAVQAAGSVSAKATLTDAPITGVVLEDGSALVAASFTYTLTYARTIARSTMRLGGTTAAIAPREDVNVKGSATSHYIATLLLRVPTKQTGGSISVVGAERVIESVDFDDSTDPDN
ncbi:hypothetical protein [Schaalia sp. lx-100]|uniref:hypothetical protein n=1 Tax=Schaalia sp. lx-100 TaxID=2899081 RepID=UPI001E54CD6C|nr:hypothetical protein [Schaalia sp. lx-100]MCD4556699.1 hypothetical protein [Schaalia sp. lx-100]